MLRTMQVMWLVKTICYGVSKRGSKHILSRLDAFETDGHKVDPLWWNFLLSKSLGTMRGHDKAVLSLAIGTTVHGLMLCSGSADHTIRMWSLNNHHAHVATLKGHLLAVQAVSAHGSRLCSGSLDQTVRVWDLDNHNVTSTSPSNKKAKAKKKK
jgi:WD40 repeat protein